MNDDWRPTCSREMLHIRAAMLRGMRQFFDNHGYLEVETPLLSHDIVVDAHLEPFEVACAAPQMFLQTSPEAGMKRLLAAAGESIFQITRSFRRGERGSRHNPEFTIVEWYGVETSACDQMTFTADLVRAAVDAAALSSAHADRLRRPYRVTRYEDAFRSVLAASVLDASTEQLCQLVRSAGLLDDIAELPADKDDLLNMLLAQSVEPLLGVGQPEFLSDYPVSQAALAAVSTDDCRVAKRFELYVGGVELCNGYQELTDAEELKRREAAQNASRSGHGANGLPGAPRLLQAMQQGLPRCSGVALGFDRVVMSATGVLSIAEVIPFPTEIA